MLMRNPGAVHVLGNLLEDICSVATEASLFEESSLQDQVGIAIADRNAKILELEARFQCEDAVRLQAREHVAAQQNNRTLPPSSRFHSQSQTATVLTKENLEFAEDSARRKERSSPKAGKSSSSRSQPPQSVAQSQASSFGNAKQRPQVLPGSSELDVQTHLTRGYKESLESCEVLLNLLDSLDKCCDKAFKKPAKVTTVREGVPTDGFGDMVARLQHQDEALAHARHKLEVARLRSCREMAMGGIVTHAKGEQRHPSGTRDAVKQREVLAMQVPPPRPDMYGLLSSADMPSEDESGQINFQCSGRPPGCQRGVKLPRCVSWS